MNNNKIHTPAKTITRKDFDVLVFDCLSLYLDRAPRKPECSEITLKMFEIMANALIEGKRVILQGYGSLCPCIRPGGRPVRNPRTGEGFVMHDIAVVRYQSTKSPLARNTEKLSGSMMVRLLADYLLSEGLPAGAADPLIKTVLWPMIRRTMTPEYRIEVRGFGVFASKIMPPRRGRNPKTGEPVDVPAKPKPYFRTGLELEKAVTASLLGDHL